MSTWIFGKSLATFDVLSEGLLASELLENSVDPFLKFFCYPIKALLISTCLSRLLPPPWVGCEQHQGGSREKSLRNGRLHA